MPLPAPFLEALARLEPGVALPISHASTGGPEHWKEAQDAIVAAGCIVLAWDGEEGLVGRREDGSWGN